MIGPLYLLPSLLPLALAIPTSTPKGTSTGATYCTGDNLTGSCTYYSNQDTATADWCKKLSAGKGSFNVYPYAACMLFDDDKCRSANSTVLSGLAGVNTCRPLWPCRMTTTFHMLGRRFFVAFYHEGVDCMRRATDQVLSLERFVHSTERFLYSQASDPFATSLLRLHRLRDS